MQNNYFSYSPNKKNNIIVIFISFIVSLMILLFVGFVLFVEKWENSRLTNKDSGYSDIPTLDKKGLDYFIETKNQNIKDNVTITTQENTQSADGEKDIGN